MIDDEGSDLRAAASSVKAPAITLLVTSIVGFLGAAGSLAMSGFVLEMMKQDTSMDEETRRAAEVIYGPGAYVIHGFSLVVTLVAIAGAISMLNTKSRALAMAGCIAAMLIPSCFCCLAGIPVGIWGLVVLSREDVKAVFARTG